MSSILEDKPFPFENSFDEVNGPMIYHRYGNREILAQVWAEKRKAADSGQYLKDGTTPNPQYPRLLIEETLARLTLDLAFVVEQNRILIQQSDMFQEMIRRMSILEDAYSGLKMASMHYKEKYLESLQTNISLSKELHQYKMAESDKLKEIPNEKQSKPIENP